MNSLKDLIGKPQQPKGNNTPQRLSVYERLELLIEEMNETDFVELPRYQERSKKTDEEMAELYAKRDAVYSEIQEVQEIIREQES